MLLGDNRRRGGYAAVHRVVVNGHLCTYIPPPHTHTHTHTLHLDRNKIQIPPNRRASNYCVSRGDCLYLSRARVKHFVCDLVSHTSCLIIILRLLLKSPQLFALSISVFRIMT